MTLLSPKSCIRNPYIKFPKKKHDTSTILARKAHYFLTKPERRKSVIGRKSANDLLKTWSIKGSFDLFAPSLSYKMNHGLSGHLHTLWYDICLFIPFGSHYCRIIFSTVVTQPSFFASSIWRVKFLFSGCGPPTMTTTANFHDIQIYRGGARHATNFCFFLPSL